MRVHISANIREGTTVPAHSSCTHIYRRTHRKTNLIMSSNVHFVSLAEIINLLAQAASKSGMLEKSNWLKFK